MDYEAIDREMSSYVVTVLKNGIRYYLNDELLATDLLSHARHWRWVDEAQKIAEQETTSGAWADFEAWHYMAVAEAKNLTY